MWCLDMRTGSPNGSAGVVSGGAEFVVLGRYFLDLSTPALI